MEKKFKQEKVQEQKNEQKNNSKLYLGLGMGIFGLGLIGLVVYLIIKPKKKGIEK